MMKAQLNTILSKEMDRKDFLKHIGVAVMMLAGAGAITQALTSLQTGRRSSSDRMSTYGHGYGSSLYGGR